MTGLRPLWLPFGWRFVDDVQFGTDPRVPEACDTGGIVVAILTNPTRFRRTLPPEWKPMAVTNNPKTGLPPNLWLGVRVNELGVRGNENILGLLGTRPKNRLLVLEGDDIDEAKLGRRLVPWRCPNCGTRGNNLPPQFCPHTGLCGETEPVPEISWIVDTREKSSGFLAGLCERLQITLWPPETP